MMPVDKVISELLSPFTSRFATSAIGALAVFWILGLLLFYGLHPQPLPGCPRGGQDICGLLSGQWPAAARTAGVLLVLVVFSLGMVFSRASELTRFLCGTTWRHTRILIAWQEVLRHRTIRRNGGRPESVYPSQPDPATPVMPVERRNRSRLRSYPHGPDVDIAPTTLGSIFVAMSQRIGDKHGLRLVSCWHLLMLVIPDKDKADLRVKTAAVLFPAQGFIWSVASAIWAALLPGLLPKILWVVVCFFAAYLAYRRMRSQAQEYCDMIEAVVVAHRKALYEVSGFAAPTPAHETTAGAQLCDWLDGELSLG